MGEAAIRYDDEERLDEEIIPRASVQIAIDVYSEHNFWSGVTMDVSAGGVFVATQKPMKPGTLLIVDMAIPGEEQPIIALTEVSWVRAYSRDSDAPPGLGLAFVHICDESLAKIQSFVQRYRAPLLFEV